MKMITRALAALGLLLMGFPANATWYVTNTYTPSGGPVSPAANPGSIGNGWIDYAGNVWGITAGNLLAPTNGPIGGSGNNFNLDTYVGRQTSENLANQQIRVRFTFAAGNYGGVRVHTSGATGYGMAYGTSSITIYKVTAAAGGVTQLISTANTTNLVSGTEYYITGSATVSAGVTTLTATVTNVSTSAVMGTTTTTDSTYSGAGSLGYYTGNTTAIGGGNGASEVVTYSDVPPPVATLYTVTGPSSGASGTASSNFTATTNGSIASAVTLTLSDGANGGTFTPSSPIIPTNGSQPSSITFTYTPASTGSKTLSFTNNGGLTNSSNKTYTSLLLIPVDSTAFRFSPMNWIGDASSCPGSQPYRCGSNYRQARSMGSWFSVTWTASGSPTAILKLNNASSTLLISYFLNGKLVAEKVSAAANITLSGIAASQSNTLKVYVASHSSTLTGTWTSGNALYNVAMAEVGGLLTDPSSSPGTAAALRPYVIVNGDSITAGLSVDTGGTSFTNTNFLHTYAYYVGQALDQSGYDFSVQAGSGDGWFVGGAFGPIYKVSSGTYNDAVSRWNKITSVVSMLDANGRLSAYGGAGQEPAAVFFNLVTNEYFQSTSQADTEASIRGALAAYRSAAPQATIIVQTPFQLQASSPTYVTYLNNALTAYKAANASDANIYGINFGAQFATMMSDTSTYSFDGTHPNQLGDAVAGGRESGAVLPLLTQVISGRITCSGSRSCAIFAGAKLTGG